MPGLTVVGQQQLVVALDDPAVEEGRLGILDVGNVVGERLSVERVAFDCVAAPEFRKQVEPGEVVRAFGSGGSEDGREQCPVTCISSGRSAAGMVPGQRNMMGLRVPPSLGLRLERAAYDPVLGLHPAVVGDVDDEGVFSDAGLVEVTRLNSPQVSSSHSHMA